MESITVQQVRTFAVEWTLDFRFVRSYYVRSRVEYMPGVACLMYLSNRKSALGTATASIRGTIPQAASTVE